MGSGFRVLVSAVVSIMLAQLGVSATVVVVVALLFGADWDEIWEYVSGDVFRAICEVARQKTGLELNPEEPLSDASVSGALSARSGIEITTVKDPEVMARDLSRHASKLIETQTGVPLTNLLSVEQIKADVVVHTGNVVFDHTGLDVRGAVGFDQIQKKVAEAVQKRLAELVVSRLRAAAEEFSNPEATLDDLLSMVYRATDAKGLKVRDVALGTAASLVVAAYATMSTPIKRRVDAYRRRALNREAQRRFRQRHGLRMRYEKLPKVVPVTGG